MMKFDEMNHRAYAREPKPKGLDFVDRLFYTALRFLYEEYFQNMITREQGQQERWHLEREYRKLRAIVDRLLEDNRGN